MMRINLCIVFYFILGNVSNSYSQADVFTIKGQVINDESGSSIPYATLRVSNSPLGTITNKNGSFSLEVRHLYNDEITLICSMVGYETKSIIVSKKEEFIHIRLSPSIMLLDELTVYSDEQKIISAERMVKNGLRKLEKYCPPHNALATLNAHLMVDGSYKKFMEAQIFIHEPEGYGKSTKRKTEYGDNVKIIQKRESLEFGLNNVKFDNHVNVPLDFMGKNALKYAFRGKGYRFNVEDTLRQENEIIYVVYAMQTRKTGVRLADMTTKYDMKFYLKSNVKDNRDFDIVKFELNESLRIEKKEYVYTENTVFTTSLKQEGSHIVPKTMECMKIQNTEWLNKKLANSKVVVYHQLVFDSVEFDMKKSINEVKANNQYDPVFWRNTPLNPQIKKELSVIIPIEEQFLSQHLVGKRILLQDSIDYLLWKNHFGTLIGHKKLYVIFWNNYQSLFREMVAAPLLNWLTDKDDTEIVFIGTNKHYGIWSGTTGSVLDYAFMNHFYLPNSWRYIVNKSCDESIPLFILIHENKEITCSSVPFSTSYLNQIN